jgi:hypothetical protein
MSYHSFNHFASNASINTRLDSVQNTRPPTFTSNATAAPPYTPNAQRMIDTEDRVERASLSSSKSSAESPNSETLLDEVETWATNTINVGDTSGNTTRPACERYSELTCHAFTLCHTMIILLSILSNILT